jgi:DNA-binding transcriptional MerR regulator
MDQFDLFGNKMESSKKTAKKSNAPQKDKVAKPAKPVSVKKDKIEDAVAATNRTDKVDDKELTKVYYTISEVAKMFDVNASLLRFWEKEFKELGKIKKNKKGDRYYNKHNIRSLNIIYYLLKEQKMTIAGARNMIKNKRKSTVAQFDMVENLQKVRGFLVDLKTALKEEN